MNSKAKELSQLLEDVQKQKKTQQKPKQCFILGLTLLSFFNCKTGNLRLHSGTKEYMRI